MEINDFLNNTKEYEELKRKLTKGDLIMPEIKKHEPVTEPITMRIVTAPDEKTWMDVKRAAFRTMDKDTETPPTLEWKKRIIRAQHSPIRMLTFLIEIKNLPSWISVHLVRHVHAQPFVSTQRNDRCDRADGYDRRKAPQDTPVSMMWYFNVEELITISHKRYCMLASAETRAVVQQMCRMIEKEYPEYRGVFEPLCSYRNGLCDEFHPCEYYVKHGHGFYPKKEED